MSVLINMEMPTGCFDCPFMYGRRYCRANSKIEFNDPDYSELKGRYDGCPLVPIPPHGRLIDADALLERFEKEEKAADEHGRDFSFSFKSGGENCTEWWPVQQMLMDAHTIIPAEEEN